MFRGEWRSEQCSWGGENQCPQFLHRLSFGNRRHECSPTPDSAPPPTFFFPESLSMALLDFQDHDATSWLFNMWERNVLFKLIWFIVAAFNVNCEFEDKNTSVNQCLCPHCLISSVNYHVGNYLGGEGHLWERRHFSSSWFMWFAPSLTWWYLWCFLGKQNIPC